MTTRPIILCPTQHELKLLRQYSDRDDFQWVCCGIGSRGVEAFAQTHVDRDRPVILAGLAGGLTAGFQDGAAAIVTQVMDSHDGSRWTPPFVIGGNSLKTDRCVITSANEPVASVEGKAQLASTIDADLVDLESVAFAEVAIANGWRWAIVRGVSDGPDRALPADIATWLTANGRIRLDKVVRSLIRQPNLCRDLLRLRRESKAALMAVALILKRI